MNTIKHSFNQPNYHTDIICGDEPWLVKGVCIS